MARINLLPWREAARQQRRKDFLTALGAALLATFGVVVLVHMYYESMIGYQQQRNQYLNVEISALNRRIAEITTLQKTKQDLISRMEIIQRLQKSRPEIVRLFDEMVTAMPEGVYLTSVQQSGRSVVVEGRAQSNARVSAFMHKIDKSQWISNPRLLLIENKDKTGTGLSHFRLSFDQTIPAEDAKSDKKA
ncbi:PilN domain-containing protein [Imhoffiella purpurea]|uniref:Type IV pilus biogenesis protein PilN n=1 Tax=Imhoffiella purpurea TaxID=1249627 RepID=W9VLW5_9GAMM|nr:PilN domain-containing protein [Imhoffiella purpurea]EXJ17097.1 Type IV pilus biogenesis protein PilN [Imhoffiella purpurea]